MNNETDPDEDITDIITLDRTIRMLLAAWVDHQKVKPAVADSDAVMYEFLSSKMNEWERKDQAWRAVISARLLSTALNAVTE